MCDGHNRGTPMARGLGEGMIVRHVPGRASLKGLYEEYQSLKRNDFYGWS